MESLSSLLMALTTSAAQGLGGGLWESLRTLLQNSTADGETSAVEALDAFSRHPADPCQAETLVHTIGERAERDAHFAAAVARWAEDTRHVLGSKGGEREVSRPHTPLHFAHSSHVTVHVHYHS